MLTWIVLGYRHLLQHPRRSLSTLVAVALGYAAVAILGGFMRYIFEGLEDAFINARGNGHLLVFPAGSGGGRAAAGGGVILLDEEQQRVIAALARRHPEVALVTSQLTVSGLISNGSESAIFWAIGRTPSAYREFRRRARGFIGRLRLFSGRELEDHRTYGVGLSSGLAGKLGLGLGATAVVLSATAEGRMNALDAEVDQFFEAPMESLNDKTMNVSLAFAQALYDTTGADCMNILLERTRDTRRLKALLQQELRAAGLQAEVRTWIECNPEYSKNRNMFQVIFGFVFTVVLVIVVLSVLNTVGMSVMERTREIGTLRALGVRRGGVVAMFATESGLLGVAGSIAGSLLTVAIHAALAWSGLSWVPPTYTGPIPLEFTLVPEYLGGGALVFTALALGAAVVPARRAARLPIPDALDHV